MHPERDERDADERYAEQCNNVHRERRVLAEHACPVHRTLRWSLQGLLTGRGSGNPYFTGQSARMAFAAAAQTSGGFAGNSVPVEGTGGPGTRDSHWRESVFTNELMTGFLNAGVNPLSAITIASLRDQGYVVDDSGADDFSFAAALRAAADQPIALAMAPWRTMVATVDRQGRVRRHLDREAGPFRR